MNDIIQDALDDLASPRSSLSRKGRALGTLEGLVADIYVSDRPGPLLAFLSLQDSFQCNIPSRLLIWISTTATRLDSLTSVPEYAISKQKPDDAAETATLATQVAQALNIVQGVALSHGGSKRYLGRRYALEILVHLFLVSRRVSNKALTPRSVSTPSPTNSADGNESKKESTPALAAAVLDTLSCILVDTPTAIRAFEDAGGVKAVVRVLKRPGTGREVKIKCMEFLYFYVNAENPTWTQTQQDTQLDLQLPSFETYAADLEAAHEAHQLDFGLMSTAPNSPIGSSFADVMNSTPPPLPLKGKSRSLPQSDFQTSPPSRSSTPQTSPRASNFTAGSSTPPASRTRNPAPATPRPTKTHATPARTTHSILRKSSDANPEPGNTESIADPEVICTPKKTASSSGLREYPKTPRKALQPLNLSSSQRHAPHTPAATSTSRVSSTASSRVPSNSSSGSGSTTSNATRPVIGLGHTRVQTHMDQVSPVPRTRPSPPRADAPPPAKHRHSSYINTQDSLAFALPPPLPTSNRPGHKRGQSSLDARRLSGESGSSVFSPRTSTDSADGRTSARTTQPQMQIQMRTKEEKTEVLRGMMNNVDALLEGMSRVGIWGLA